MRLELYICGVLCTVGSVLGHMEMKWPYPHRSRFDPHNRPCGGSDPDCIDYDLKNPLKPDGSNFPCKNYHKEVPYRSVMTYDAGQNYEVMLDGTAVHGGGSCQISLSYNNGSTWHVIKSYMGGCPLHPDQTYSFRLPSDVSDGEAMLAWSWFNLIGAREMYMNCAWISIRGGSGDGEKKLPKLFEANIDNHCATTEREETVFAKPGPQLEYGGDVKPTSTPYPKCDGNDDGKKGPEFADQLTQFPFWGWL